jgi:hypothetical protein
VFGFGGLVPIPTFHSATMIKFGSRKNPKWDCGGSAVVMTAGHDAFGVDAQTPDREDLRQVGFPWPRIPGKRSSSVLSR